MPLMQSASRPAFQSNLRAELAANKPRDQALAIAYAVQRRNRMALGGVPGPSFYARRAMDSIARAGLIKSPVAGRTDRINMNVPKGSYILPADHVSHLGQGNSLAGGQILDSMLRTNVRPHHPNIPKPPRLGGQFSNGGLASINSVRDSRGIYVPDWTLPNYRPTQLAHFADGGTADSIPIVVAGGEYLIHPDQVAELGGGDIDEGHDALDQWVKSARKQHVKLLSSLPGPKTD